ncbi:LLM class flavin-dependent oxidoreductase [Bacillus solitudinis]|uniref:LLM class flavin-dependent oxidoreductase n=1 Tax=Bacillus solitudinis TaxID=2014074 RepID=UPI000C23CFD2|nr:LLM class flavin-dependent oxidoreductase [Bacillus solitudinis]
MSIEKGLRNVKKSVLDLAPIIEGSTPTDSFKNSLDLAQHAEKWGYNRYWFAEHHNMPGIASSATSIIIGHIAAGTSTIRVGSGGIMLPNHAPLVIAEQFGTLESLFPGRIDLGLGRAPGTDHRTAFALRRDRRSDSHNFPEQLAELRAYFNPSLNDEPVYVRSIPGEGLSIPIWLLGSSGFSAQLAAQLGLPFAFANHFAPENTMKALELYYANFNPSEVLEKPYAIAAVNVIAADTDNEAQWLSTSMQQQFLNLVRNNPSPLKPPVDSMDDVWSSSEKIALQSKLTSAMVGSPDTVKTELEAFLKKTNVDEIIINGQIYDHKARLRSFEIVSEL